MIFQGNKILLTPSTSFILDQINVLVESTEVFRNVQTNQQPGKVLKKFKNSISKKNLNKPMLWFASIVMYEDIWFNGNASEYFC